MQIKVSLVNYTAKVELIDAPALDGTERQIEAATGIRLRTISTAAEESRLLGRPVEQIQVALNRMAPHLASVTAKQWLDAYSAVDQTYPGEAAMQMLKKLLPSR